MTDRSTGTPRLLAVVDDNEEFRAIVRAVAEPIGWQVSEFSNGAELFVGLARDFRPELIMLDMVMPEMDGIETIAALGASSVRCPVILMTGRLPLYTRTADQLGRAHGIEILEILQKPVPLARLRAVLGHPAAPGR
ncbi:MAG TPA: response regulator [Thermohalobaculum sp.]|nr:response regulator [Thermohalobaculum sp.]